jgi:hypothetical protein
MGLTEIQAAQARLYTRASDRNAFYADPAGTGQRWGLTQPETEILIRTPRAQVEAFARSLIAKRRGEIAKILPLTCAALGPSLIPLFRQHAEQYIPTEVHRHDGDAAAFARFVAAGPLPEGSFPWASDAARFELARLSMSRTGRPRFLLLRYDLRPLLQAHAGGDRNGLERVSTLIIFLPAGAGKWRMKIWRMKRSPAVSGIEVQR